MIDSTVPAVFGRRCGGTQGIESWLRRTSAGPQLKCALWCGAYNGCQLRVRPATSGRRDQDSECLFRVDSTSLGSGGAVGGAVLSAFRSFMTALLHTAAVRTSTGPATQRLLGVNEREFDGCRAAAATAALLTLVPSGGGTALGRLLPSAVTSQVIPRTADGEER